MNRVGGLVLLTLIVVASLLATETGDAKKGKTVYTRACQKCHGADGNGVEAIAKALKVTLIPLRAEEVQKKSDEEIGKLITEGVGKMKKVQGLSPQDVKDVIVYVRTMAQKEE